MTHFVALQNDITKRVRAEREIAAREAYLCRMLNSTQDAIIVIDPACPAHCRWIA